MNMTRGQTTLIAGASKGIGANIARTLTGKGLKPLLAAQAASGTSS